MDTSLDSLSLRFKLRAEILIARIVEARIPIVIVNTRRTMAEQALNIANGVSWTKNSKHLTGDAIDLCPYEVYQLHGPDKLHWDSEDPIWLQIGKIGESLGLVWGGRWKQKDMGHFEFKDDL